MNKIKGYENLLLTENFCHYKTKKGIGKTMFCIGQSKNGAIIMHLGSRSIILTFKQIHDLSLLIDNLLNFSYKDFAKFYNNKLL